MTKESKYPKRSVTENKTIFYQRRRRRHHLCPVMKLLVELAVAAVAHLTPVQELLTYVEYLPTAIRHQLFHEMSDFRLREMEMAWEAAANVQVQEPRDGFHPLAGDKFLFDTETQREWKRRMKAARLSNEMTMFPMANAAAAQECRRSPRLVFWEYQFRSFFKLRTPLRPQESMDILVDYQKLFVDVVEVLKVHGREVCEDNVKLLLALRQLRRLEIHHPEQQQTCWKTMKYLLQGHRQLTELGFFHGKLSDTQIAHIRTTLVKPAPTLETSPDTRKLTTLELVSVKIRPEGYRQLVRLVTDMPHLLQLRLSNSISDFDTKLIIDAAFRSRNWSGSSWSTTSWMIVHSLGSQRYVSHWHCATSVSVTMM